MSTLSTSFNNLTPTMQSGLPEASPGDSQGSTDAEIQSLLNELSELMQQQMQQGLNGTGSGNTDPAGSGSELMETAAPSAGGTNLPQSGTPASSDGNSDSYAALDSYAAQNDQSDLSKWSNLAASSQGISLERPIAAMQILSGKPNANGQPPTSAQKQAAMQYVDDNPSLKSALQNAGALNSSGSINQSKLTSFMQSVESDLSQADSNVQAYMKKNPNADASSLDTVRAAALLQAYNPIAGESTGHVSNGGKNQSYSGSGKNNGGGLVTEQQVKNLANNQGFSSALTSAANAFSTSGAFDALDRAGDDKATAKADGMYNNANLTSFITSDAPTSSATDQVSSKTRAWRTLRRTRTSAI
jgi:Type III secretion system translocator protein, HrpF